MNIIICIQKNEKNITAINNIYYKTINHNTIID